MVEKTHTAGWWPSIYEPLRTAGEKIADWFAPASEAAASANQYEIAIELPGVAEADIDVTVQDGVLTVRGEKAAERESAGKSYYFSERTYGSFQRSFRLPEDADQSAIAADLKDGILTIKVPKTAPAESRAQKIAVNRT
jgi:HSP20 family protein